MLFEEGGGDVRAEEEGGGEIYDFKKKLEFGFCAKGNERVKGGFKRPSSAEYNILKTGGGGVSPPPFFLLQEEENKFYLWRRPIFRRSVTPERGRREKNMGQAEVLLQTAAPSISKFTALCESTPNIWEIGIFLQ